MPFTLPKASTFHLDSEIQVRVSPPEDNRSATSSEYNRKPTSIITNAGIENVEEEEDIPQDQISGPSVRSFTKPILNGAPITMQSLAESESAKAKQRKDSKDTTPDVVSRNDYPIRRQVRRSTGGQKRRPYSEISEEEEDKDSVEDLTERVTRQGKRARNGSNTNSIGATPTRRSLRPRRQKSEAALEAERKAEEALREVLESDSD